MALRRKGSAPWSLTKETGLSDAPVSGTPFVEGDEVKPVIDAGFIDGKGLWQINKVTNDSQFTFQDPSQALAAGASIFIDANMLNHDVMIFAILDASGNGVSVELQWRNPATPEGPYVDTRFEAAGFNSGFTWKINQVNSSSSENVIKIVGDAAETLSNTWQVFKFVGMRGTVGTLQVKSNEGADAGTISTAYLRLV